MLVHIALSISEGSGKSALMPRLIKALAAHSHTQSMDVDKKEAITHMRLVPRNFTTFLKSGPGAY